MTLPPVMWSETDAMAGRRIRLVMTEQPVRVTQELRTTSLLTDRGRNERATVFVDLCAAGQRARVKTVYFKRPIGA